MKTYKIILLLTFILLGGRLFAQNAISCTGGSGTGPGSSSMSFTVGQIDFTHVTGYWEGVQQPYSVNFVNGYIQAFTICENASTYSLNAFLAVTDPVVGQTVTWSARINPAHGILAAAYTTTSTGTELMPTGLSYMPTTGFTGSDSFKVAVVGGNDTTYTTIHVTISPIPAAGSIFGMDSVCAGASITLTDTTASIAGTWHTGSGATATISGSGTSAIVTGASAGTVNIFYTTTNACGTDTATHTISVKPMPDAGTISGAPTVCLGSTITLTESSSTGTWSSSNTARATVSVGGVVTSVSVGAVSIQYSATNSCGTANAYKTVTVTDIPVSITGDSAVCVGSTTTLHNTIPGGLWSSSNILVASAGFSTGAITGGMPGATTITYSTGCGIAATFTFTVNPLPITGTITAPDSICVGATLTVSESVTGGTWSCSNANATLSGTLVTAVAAGRDTILYQTTNSCGTARAAKIITIVPAATSAGTISGHDSLCIAATSTLSASVAGGVWSESNNHAAITVGVVTGVSAGTDTILYTISGFCGANYTSMVVTIGSVPAAVTISGSDSLCPGGSATYTAPGATGIWACTNANAIIASGVATAVSAGLDTIRYSVTNFCGTAISSKIITINTLPNAGVITGAANVCAGASVTLFNYATGGVWSTSNADATVSGGVVAGAFAGMDTISYTVTNLCGVRVATAIENIIAQPVAGAISGGDSVCVYANINLTTDIVGGSWATSNSNASIYAGMVTGSTGGLDTIYYIVSNVCGADSASITVYVMPLPAAGMISGNDSVCAGKSITLTDTAAGGVWSSGVSTIGSTDSAIFSTSPTGLDTISYKVTNSCTTAIATKTIYVKPMIAIGQIVGNTSVCVGDTIVLTDSVPGGTWSSGNTSAILLGNSVIGVSDGPDTITYRTVSSCGSATTTKFITVNSIPVPGILGQTYVCIGKTTTLSGSPTGGIWTAANNSATITSGGVVTGLLTGTDTFVYQVGNICGTANALATIKIPTAWECDSINLVPAVPGDPVNVLVYPNPNSGAFTVELPGNISLAGTSIVVTDLLGKTITTKIVEDNTTRFINFNFNNLASATYFVKVTIGENTYRTKVVIW